MSVLEKTFYREGINSGNSGTIEKKERVWEGRGVIPPRSGLVLHTKYEPLCKYYIGFDLSVKLFAA